ncbi:MAG: L-fucose/L-arabinose isomerase family protein [Candidatus Hydrogenedentes bacterium]|nr:L-fucose/L-arabinose isomerase family protein [Candidatus Hydrogenedentota bacterium]
MNNVSGTVRVGLYGIGLDTYWPQFKGLRERLEGYQSKIAARLEQCGADDLTRSPRPHASHISPSSHSPRVQVINAGLVDNVEAARESALLFKRENVEVIFLYVSTYALSSTVLPVVQQVKVPVVVLNLQPVPAIDYDAFNSLGDRGVMTGEWLANCQACSAPEIACVFNRAGIDYHLVSGYLEDEEAWREIEAWVEAARVAAVMRNNRVGVLGHYYCGMLDVYSDMTQQARYLGCHFELLEMCQLKECRDAVTDATLRAKIDQIETEFDVSPECEASEVERAARTACALDALVEHFKLGALAYYYESTAGNPYQDIVTSVITGNSLLTAHNVPVAGECEIKNVQAMKIMDAFGVGGSFSEFYLMDFVEDVVLLGHDGPGHMAIAEGKVKLVPLGVYHGKPGKGLSIEMMVKNGPVTLLSLVQDGAGKLKLLVAEGESVPGPIMRIGNTNSRYSFSIGAKNFVNAWSKAGPAHHCAIGVGHIAQKLEKLAAILGMECVRVS